MDMAAEMKEDSYIVIQAFMLNDLKLKGNELIIYAVIYGYSQDGNHWFYGTRSHLAEWCGASKGTVSNCLKSLVEKGYLRRREVQRPGYSEVQYQAVHKNCTPIPKIGRGGAKNYEGAVSKIASIDNKGNTKEYKADDGEYKSAFPESVPCECGGVMLKTNCTQTGTGRPYYRCGECGDERVLR